MPDGQTLTLQCSQRDANINTVVMKWMTILSMIKLQEIKVLIVSPFKDGSIHFLKIKLYFQWKMQVTVMRCVHMSKIQGRYRKVIYIYGTGELMCSGVTVTA